MASVFREHPRPDGSVIALLERTLAAARLGHVKLLVVVSVNPLNEVEQLSAGEFTHTRSNAALAGLVRAQVEVANLK